MCYMEKIALGGGCHWCTEAVFQSLRGVDKVEQGFVASTGSHSTFSEAIIVHFKPESITLKDLVEIHLHTHKSTSDHSMRDKYRSAVYSFSQHQHRDVIGLLKLLQKDFSAPLITQVLPFVSFKPSEAHFQNYYISNPEKPFCKAYIAPKLQLLLSQFRTLVASVD
ncbi:peptide-methionine (S)-S-oxide reductase [Zobellia uliginosa]|uniref:peptide-methionine (S)-S-oxide reductase n=1 Tax=Zobellia uliginosa TaxID=143224 RepID=UPI003F5F7071